MLLIKAVGWIVLIIFLNPFPKGIPPTLGLCSCFMSYYKARLSFPSVFAPVNISNELDIFGFSKI